MLVDKPDQNPKVFDVTLKSPHFSEQHLLDSIFFLQTEIVAFNFTELQTIT